MCVLRVLVLSPAHQSLGRRGQIETITTKRHVTLAHRVRGTAVERHSHTPPPSEGGPSAPR